jgi:hypothetical protein
MPILTSTSDQIILTTAFGSILFNGANQTYSQYLSIPTAAKPTGVFTIESYVYITDTGFRAFVSYGNTGSNFRMFIQDSARQITVWSGFSTIITATYSASILNTWAHIAITRNERGYISVFLNGTCITTFGYSGNFTGSLRIGSDTQSTAYNFSGYMSNFRLVIGVAVYGGFAPGPSAALTAVTNTQLLLNAASSGTYLTDGSNNNFSLTATGNVTYSSNNPISSGGSLYFDQSVVSYLTVPSSTAFNLTGDFTIEAWIYITTLLAGENGILDARVTSGNNVNQPWAFYVDGSGHVAFFTGNYYNGTTVINTNVWTHVALSRSGSINTLWVNGVVDAGFTGGYGNGSFSPGTTSAVVGTKNYGLGSQYRAINYISNLRFVNGSAIYTSGTSPFTPPRQLLTATQSASGNIAAITGTQANLVLNFSPYGSTTSVKVHASWIDTQLPATSSIPGTLGRTNTIVSVTGNSYTTDSSAVPNTVTIVGAPSSSTFAPYKVGTTSISSILSSPGANQQRTIKYLSAFNSSTTTATVFGISLTDGTNISTLWSGRLMPQQSISFTGSNWQLIGSGGGSQVLNTNTPDIQDFTTAGSAVWTKPTSFTPAVVYVQVWGGGGGGGGQADVLVSSTYTGGAGGGGGAYNEYLFAAADLPDRVALTIGAGGLPGGAPITAPGSGTAGTAGGTSNFGGLVYAFGGGGGAGGVVTTGPGSGGGGGGRGSAGSNGTTAASAGGLPLANAGTGAVSGSGAGGPITAVTTHNAEFGGGGGGGFVSTADSGFGGGGSLRGGGGGGAGAGAVSSSSLFGPYSGGLSGSYTASITATSGGANGRDGDSTRGGDGGDGSAVTGTAGNGGLGGGGGGGQGIISALAGGNGGNGRIIVYAW